MKCLMLICLFLFSSACIFAQVSETDWVFPTTADYPSVQKSGMKITDFVPVHWKIMGQAWGDLNSDGNKDTALVIENTSSKFKQKNNGFGDDMFDTNPRL